MSKQDIDRLLWNSIGRKGKRKLIRYYYGKLNEGRK